MDSLFTLFIIMAVFFIATRVITYLLLEEVDKPTQNKPCSYHNWEWIEGRGHVCKTCNMKANYIGRE